MKKIWNESLLFRRMAALTVFIVVACLVYLGSHIPRAIQLPADDLNNRTLARVSEEQIIIAKPEVAPEDLVLSYTGSGNEVASVSLESATLDETDRQLLLPHALGSAPTRISYTSAAAEGAPSLHYACRTTIQIRRAANSVPIESLKLYQTDVMAGAQRFRQLVLDAGAGVLAIEVHTDAPADEPSGLVPCRKLLTVGDNPSIDMPIPVHLLVRGGLVDLHFNPADPTLSIWTGTHQTFEGVSLGASGIRGRSLQIISRQRPIPAQLDVQPFQTKDGITFSGLKLGSDTLRLDIGSDTEKALVYANGSSIYNYNLMDSIQKNIFLSLALTALLGAVLQKWIAANLFPKPGKQQPESSTDAATLAERKPRRRGGRRLSRGQ